MKLMVGYCAYLKYVLLILSIHLQVISTLIMKCLPIVEVVLADIAIVQVVVTLNCAGLAGSGAVEWRCWIMWVSSCVPGCSHQPGPGHTIATATAASGDWDHCQCARTSPMVSVTATQPSTIKTMCPTASQVNNCVTLNKFYISVTFLWLMAMAFPFVQFQL